MARCIYSPNSSTKSAGSLSKSSVLRETSLKLSECCNSWIAFCSSLLGILILGYPVMTSSGKHSSAFQGLRVKFKSKHSQYLENSLRKRRKLQICKSGMYRSTIQPPYVHIQFPITEAYVYPS
ncbi:hypothetical protein IQ07DRAFT_72298 [Pyrenochaeta sp. DS3sAY3a]|nr:hypothetical protein IQ07DRAFT_72298 [Pyrenochaeta sp. DS3sAY3a]